MDSWMVAVKDGKAVDVLPWSSIRARSASQPCQIPDSWDGYAVAIVDAETADEARAKGVDQVGFVIDCVDRGIEVFEAGGAALGVVDDGSGIVQSFCCSECEECIPGSDVKITCGCECHELKKVEDAEGNG